MPAGKLIDPHSAEKKREELKVKQVLKEMTPKDMNVPKGDPMDFPPEFSYLMKELHQVGGIKFSTLPEVKQICSLIHESELTDELKDTLYKVMSNLINYANLWIIHYNRHKKV